MQGTSPTIHGDGEQTRDFTYVDDVVDLIIKASKTPGVSGKVFNAGNGNRYSLNEIWETLQRIEGVKIPANYGPTRAGDVRDSQADTTAAVRELGITLRVFRSKTVCATPCSGIAPVKLPRYTSRLEAHVSVSDCLEAARL